MTRNHTPSCAFSIEIANVAVPGGLPPVWRSGAMHDNSVIVRLSQGMQFLVIPARTDVRSGAGRSRSGRGGSSRSGAKWGCFYKALPGVASQ